MREGEITTLLGANGAGKTTTLKAISGLLHAERGEVTKGAIELDGERIDRLPPHEVVRRGVVQVFEGRRVFEHLTVEENLVAGGHVQRDARACADGIERVYRVLPAAARSAATAQAGYLSGGEQQMLVIGRALMSEPEGDPARRAVARAGADAGRGDLRDRPAAQREEGLTVLLVEQNAALALDIADHGYVMENGRIVLEGPADAAPERRHQGVLPRPHRGRRAQIVPRREALQAPQALAQLITRGDANETSAGVGSPAALRRREPGCLRQHGRRRPRRSLLYKRLGGREGIALVVGDFTANMAADPRVNARFKDMKAPELEKFKSNLADQICDATGGPCSYLGKDMKATHQGMKITDAEWNATVENLVKALDKNNVDAKSKGELLAALGPMKKDIVGQ